MGRWMVVLAALLAGAGCGSKEEEAEHARTSCELLKSTICNRAVECTRDTDPAAHTKCEQTIATNVDCGQAVGLSDSFPRCLEELRTFTCAALVPGGTEFKLPASCLKVIKTTMDVKR